MKTADPRIDPALVPEGSYPIVVGEKQPQFTTLPTVRTPGGQVVTRWTPSAEERRAILNGADIFVTILSPGQIKPLLVTVGPIDWKATEPRYSTT